MKAAVLRKFGVPLSVEEIPDPSLGTGEILVDIVAAPVLNYANEVFSGKRGYLMELPMVPGTGAGGCVLALGPDATHLAVGDWILCDPAIRSRDDAFSPDITLHGLSAGGEGGLHLQQYYHNGSFAEKMMMPTENAVKMPSIDHSDGAKWCAVNTMLVPYGGFLSAKLQPGETVAISGATGNFGSTGVAVALAMGASCVIALGRNEKVLNDLVQCFGKRKGNQ